MQSTQVKTTIDSTKKISIPFMPNDILFNVFQQLVNDQHTLFSCCLVSKQFLSIAQPVLYRKITLFQQGVPAAVGAGSSKTTSLKTHLLKNTEALTVGYHEATECEGMVLIMPKLITLTITPSYLGRTMQLCRGKRGYRHCELLEAITPRRLIIRNADVLRFGLPETVPPKIFEDVEELIFISPTEIPNGAGIPQLPKMAKLKRFTRIFWTDKPSDDWRSTPYNDRRWKILSVAYRTVRNLASAISSLRNGVQVLIVNSGPLQELCRDSDPGKSLREQTEEHIRTSLAFQAWGIYIQPGTRDSREDVLRAKAKFISDNIKYLTMEQYLNQGDWQDFLTSKEVDGWIDKEKFRPDNHY